MPTGWLPIKTRVVALATLGLTALSLGPALAGTAEEAAMQAFLDARIRTFATDPVIIAALTAQNARTAGLAQTEIEAMDQTWRAEVGAAETPTITPVLGNAASDFLRGQVEAAAGAITEVFVMDVVGLNVASSGVTSDYWQGDEAKFTETFGKGPDAAHFGDIERDESTGTYQAQISLTLVDPATGTPIGAMTVGVNAEALF